ncbi:LTA synthase family protein [Lactococcus petauri]|uniref:LTA synthase family protein n=1 Tax=Lactococcus petauri TaxID=1940789 RepID=UPI0031FEA1F9
MADSITMESIVFMLITALLLTSLSIVLVGIFEYQFGLLLFSLINALIYIGSSIKMNTTGVPVMWADFNSGLFWDVVWNMYLKQNYPYIILSFVIVVLLFYFMHTKKISILTFQTRMRQTLIGGIGLVTILVLVGKVFVTTVHSKSFEEQGSLVYFISSREVDAMSSSGILNQYSQEKMEKIVKKYEEEFSTKKNFGKDDETVITVLSESLADPKSFSGISWKEDPMPNFRKLQNASGGYLQSTMFGGGTTNVEFSVLTGFNYSFFNQQINAFDYLNQNTDKNQSIAQYKNDSIAVHTHLKAGYHRDEVLPNLGFSKFIGREELLKMENKNSAIYYAEGYLSDYTLFEQILNELSSSTEKNLLVHGLSMQNHYPYTEDLKGKLENKDVLISGNNLNAEQKQLALYARGVKKTDEALGTFIQSLEALDRNVTVIMYGDHYPALDNSVYMKYPVKSDENKLINDHSTPYFVWKNHNRKSENVSKTVTPEGLAVLAMKEGNTKVPVFYQLVDQLEKTDKETSIHQEMLEDYELIQYDMLEGEQYSKELFDK